MPGHMLLISLSVAPGAEDDYRQWHDRHIRQVVDHVAGVDSAQRFELGPANDGQADGARFVAVYALSGEPFAVRDSLKNAGQNGLAEPPPPGIIAGASSLIYRSTGDVIR